MPRGLRTVDSPPAIAAVVAVLIGLVASVQFSVPTSQTYGIATLYLWPIAIVALWFGATHHAGREVWDSRWGQNYRFSVTSRPA